jgi:CRISPR/Cas system Type II protein with McrA/HNH and RuvC-like nuclease domain
MTKRQELRERYNEYEREVDKLKEMVPEDEVLEIEPIIGGKIQVIYNAEYDELEIARYDKDGTMQNLFFSGYEAEEIYHFFRWAVW